MPNDEQPEKVWDEHDWERFLQQQDRKTEKYMELLDRFIDDPNRDQIIAREMGWNHLLNKEGEEWAENVDSQFDAEALEDDVFGEQDEEDAAGHGESGGAGAFSFEVHPLYKSAIMLTAWVDELFEQAGDEVAGHPAAVMLVSQTSLASAKLAAALTDDDIDEIGMTIAYLKRSLRFITTGLECAAELREEKAIDGERFGGLSQQLFRVRDGIIELMGQYRAEWRRRFET